MHIGLHSAHYTLQTYRMHAHTVLTLSFPFLPFLVFSVELPESLLKTDDVEMITKAKWMENKQRTSQNGEYSFECVPADTILCVYMEFITLFCFFLILLLLFLLRTMALLRSLCYTVLYTTNKWIFWLDLVVNSMKKMKKM